MSGMGSGLNVSNPAVVAAFRAALWHGGLAALIIFAVLGLGRLGLGRLGLGRLGLGRLGLGRLGLGRLADAGALTEGGRAAEPAGRQMLLIGFGNLWLFDGFLQMQPKMPIGLPSQVMTPTAAASPQWVQNLVSWAATTWSYHPIQAAAAAVWIQVGLGVWLVAAPRGALSRLAGLTAAGWGLAVWVFGESFGGVFAPGLSWLTGAPGAALVYVAAGAVIALPPGAWRSPRLGRLILGSLGLFLAGMAVLQAWPGRGSWQGTAGGQPGMLAGMTESMALTPQPGFLSAWVAAFGAFDEAHGFALNLFVLAVLAVTAAALLTMRPRLVRPALAGLAALCVADWVLVQDVGFLGGLGTDPNSMIPFILIAVSGYLALTRPAAAQTGPAAAGPLRRRAAAAGTGTMLALGGACLVALGVGPMLAAQASPAADPVLAESITGSPARVDYPAPGFTLTDQHGQPVRLASLRGKVVLLSFLDPACTARCPVGREFRQAALLLGADSRAVALVGVSTSRVPRAVGLLRAFSRREGLDRVPGWLCLTGTRSQLRRVWQAYGITGPGLPAGGPAPQAQRPAAFLIDRSGHVRRVYRAAGASAGPAVSSSFAVLFANAARRALAAPGGQDAS